MEIEEEVELELDSDESFYTNSDSDSDIEFILDMKLINDTIKNSLENPPIKKISSIDWNLGLKNKKTKKIVLPREIRDPNHYYDPELSKIIKSQERSFSTIMPYLKPQINKNQKHFNIKNNYSEDCFQNCFREIDFTFSPVVLNNYIQQYSALFISLHSKSDRNDPNFFELENCYRRSIPIFYRKFHTNLPMEGLYAYDSCYSDIRQFKTIEFKYKKIKKMGKNEIVLYRRKEIYEYDSVNDYWIYKNDKENKMIQLLKFECNSVTMNHLYFGQYECYSPIPDGLFDKYSGIQHMVGPKFSILYAHRDKKKPFLSESSLEKNWGWIGIHHNCDVKHVSHDEINIQKHLHDFHNDFGIFKRLGESYSHKNTNPYPFGYGPIWCNQDFFIVPLIRTQ